jgi:hypothetical protein
MTDKRYEEEGNNPRKERESAREDGAQKECSDPGKGSVPDMETDYFLDPEGDGVV